MRKRLLLLFWCLLLVISVADAARPGRGTAGVRKAKATARVVINPITLYKESHALLIGASAYQHWPRLRGVLTDVSAVQTALEQQGFTVTTVLNPDRATLTAAFDDFINQYGLDANNRLLIYFAGHGYTLKKTMGEMGYIVPVDAPNPLDDLKGFLRFGLDMAQIEVYAQRIDSKHALFVFDSCFSGSVFALSGRRGITPPLITYKTAMPVRQFITSGSADEEVPDASMFRRQFVSGLGGEADSNGDGYITGKELGMFLEDKVINYSRDTQHPQFGTLRNPELDKGDFVFQVAASEQPPPPQPETVVPLPPDNNGISFTDLEAEDRAHKDRAARSGWDKRQEQMQSDFAKTAAFAGSAASQRKAWARFLTTYADDNTFSREDERLRQEAERRQAAVRDEPEVIVEPPVVVPDRQSLTKSQEPPVVNAQTSHTEKPATGSITAFSTSPGKTAADGVGHNSPYVKHLLLNMNTPGLDIHDFFKLVRIGVMQETHGEKTPGESSTLVGKFCFVDCIDWTNATPQEAKLKRRVALVIGNAAYANLNGELINPVNDAKDIAKALRNLGFEVDLHLNVTNVETMRKIVEHFGSKLQNGGVGLFYYGGEGVQIDGENYLMPVDIGFADNAEYLKRASLGMSRVLSTIEEAGNGMNIIILETSRDNPFALLR